MSEEIKEQTALPFQAKLFRILVFIGAGFQLILFPLVFFLTSLRGFPDSPHPYRFIEYATLIHYGLIPILIIISTIFIYKESGFFFYFLISFFSIITLGVILNEAYSNYNSSLFWVPFFIFSPLLYFVSALGFYWLRIRHKLH